MHGEHGLTIPFHDSAHVYPSSTILTRLANNTDAKEAHRV